MKRTTFAFLISSLIGSVHAREPDPIHGSQPDRHFLAEFAAYAASMGVDSNLATTDAQNIFAEIQKPWSQTLDQDGTVDRPGNWVGVVRHLKSAAVRRLSDDGWVEWLTVCRDFRAKHGGVNCEIQLTSH
jgi:hypothetical protein